MKRFLLLFLPALSACSNANASPELLRACRAIGMCDAESTAPPPEVVDVLCDDSAGSSCNKETLDRTLKTVLRRATERPGTRVRLWLLGVDAATTANVGEQVSPSFARGSERARKGAAERFVARATEFFQAASAHVLRAPPIRKSPLAEAITKIALADADGVPRRIIAITDAREMSNVWDLECFQIPPNEAYARLLRRQRLLDPGLLAGSSVEFVFVEPAPVPGRGCPTDLARLQRVKELWTFVLKSAGAAEVRLSAGPPALKPMPNKTPKEDNE